ncbi:hypothetical protein [Actinoallomurus soli]|uniref:hypothetical protein n=1 Tax=Actinoallomurus soli TaxID=2952535 RepID=UPI002092F78A|nr:hypothetical protein [Actinoallomurus soli]MCO5968386.1 hypothetical protein [Actinoallomurus soli]
MPGRGGRFTAFAQELIPSLLTLSDVMGTGWYAAVAEAYRAMDERRAIKALLRP